MNLKNIPILTTTTVIILILQTNVSFADVNPKFESTKFETWTSAYGSEMEARLINAIANGRYILLTKEGKQITVTKNQLNLQSRERLDELTITEPKPTADSPALASKGGSNVSFFGTPVSITGGTTETTTNSSQKKKQQKSR